MKKNQIARLETRIDYLEAELIYLNKLLLAVGFSDGIQSLKESAEELLASQDSIFPFHETLE